MNYELFPPKRESYYTQKYGFQYASEYWHFRVRELRVTLEVKLGKEKS